MKTIIRIKYQPRGGDIHPIIDIADIKTLPSIFTRGIGIDSVIIHADSSLNIYLVSMPARIDRQGDDLWLINEDWADRHPEPTELCSNYDLWGKPQTIWQREVVTA